MPTYYLGPYRFESELHIPELQHSVGPADRLVHIRLGSVPTGLQHPAFTSPGVQLSPNELLLDIPDVARYYVANGNQVRVDPVPGVPIANVSTYLLGSVFGALCHQNGLLPLHASAVDCPGGVTAFLGDSGAGKSTLAAALHRRGHTVVCDDICLVDPTNPAAPHVIPVAGWLKLWDRALEHLGETPQQQNRVFATDDKYRVYLPAIESTPRPLAHLVILQASSNPDAPATLTPVPLTEAVAALMDLTYAVQIPLLTGQQPQLFQRCAAILRRASAWRLTRPWSLDRSAESIRLLESELLHSTRQTT